MLYKCEKDNNEKRSQSFMFLFCVFERIQRYLKGYKLFLEVVEISIIDIIIQYNLYYLVIKINNYLEVKQNIVLMYVIL